MVENQNRPDMCQIEEKTMVRRRAVREFLSIYIPNFIGVLIGFILGWVIGG